jgi:hypothetical protein
MRLLKTRSRLLTVLASNIAHGKGRIVVDAGEDLPQPEAPWKMMRCCLARRAITSSIIDSRPKKMAHLDGSKGRKPG